MNAQQLKNSILQEAIEGRLVPQDPNDEPASVLLERIRKEKAKLVKEGKLKKKDLVETPITEDEIPFKIPESWEWTRIGTIFNHSSGKQLSGSNTEGTLREYITTSNLYWGRFELDNLKSMYYKDSEIEKCTATQGDLLVCEGGDVGRSAIWPYDYDICLQNHVHRLRPYDNRYTMLVFYIMWFYKSIGLIGGKGIGIQGLSASALKNIIIPLPPLEEQKRIVARIEELLPKVEEYGKAQDSLDKLNEELPERLKKSILQEAIEGRLVPQDPNEEPASVLLDKIRKEKARLVREGKLKKKDLEETPISEDEIPFKIPDSWEWCKLGTIAALIGGFAFKSHEYTSSGSRVIRISDITENGFINKNVVRFPFTDKLSQYVILEGDILMAMTGGTVGKSLYVKYLPEETMLLNQRVALIRPNIVFTDYIDYVIKSQHIQGIITEAKNSTNDNISMGDLYNFPIPLPPLAEQKRIVAKIEQLMKEINKLKV